MDWYTNYLENVSQTPNREYRDTNQAFINSTWEDTTLISKVEEEVVLGSNEFYEIEVWKNTVSEFNVNTIKDSKDYRRLMFKDQEHIVTRGHKYRFKYNYWLCYEETSEEEPFCEILVRRCNNICKWKDKDNGFVYEEPCILDYNLMSPSVQYTKDTATANSSVTLILQGNENTHKIKKNQRFIFNGVPYSFKAYNNYMQENYVTKEVPLLFLDCYLDQENPNDDLENNIANAFDYIYDISIEQSDLEQPFGTIGQLTAETKLNGNVADLPIEWSTSNEEVVTIDEDGNYEVVGEVGEVATIRANILGNKDTYSEITITVSSMRVVDKILIVTPNITEMNEYDTETIDANVYVGGMIQSDEVFCVPNWSNPNYYTLTKSGNNRWTLVANKYNAIPLVLTFISGELQQTLTIKIEGLF